MNYIVSDFLCISIIILNAVHVDYDEQHIYASNMSEKSCFEASDQSIISNAFALPT